MAIAAIEYQEEIPIRKQFSKYRYDENGKIVPEYSVDKSSEILYSGVCVELVELLLYSNYSSSETPSERTDNIPSNHHSEKQSELVLYPNPASEQITIQLPNDGSSSEKMQVEIFDVYGVTHLILQDQQPGSVYKLSIGTLPEGIYTVAVKSGGKSYCSRFAKH